MPVTGKIPNGLQQHALWRMDGRVWIEPSFPTDDPKSQKLRATQEERGWRQPIPQDKLAEFIAALLVEREEYQ